ncbi:MAG TPA: hypothetical protein P5329_02785 [Candidatus Competibacteraceae bacterium]|nr:hypothetical protein [Candidatus Competibacteraceae bacterium]
MTDQNDMQNLDSIDAPDEEQRRAFLRGLGKWSQAVIGGVLLGGVLVNSPSVRAGGWINRRGGWGGGWANRGGGSAGWINGGGGWVNRGGSWINRGGGSWINRRGGGSVGWINRR